MPETNVLAIATADIHLSSDPPISRSVEKDWFKVMASYLTQLADLQEEYRCPIFVAGDLFNKWNTTPELISFAIANIPNHVWAVPGNHDLPDHNYRELKRSAYWTLVEAGKLNNLEPGVTTHFGPLAVTGFPHGFQVQPPSNPGHSLMLQMALVHAYIWTQHTGYQTAPAEARLGSWRAKLQDYDIAVFGDNHKGFLSQSETECSVLNCGTFMRRISDEKNYKTCVGLINMDGTITRHYLDTKEDKFMVNKAVEALEECEKWIGVNMTEFLVELSTMSDSAIKFGDALKRFMEKNKVPQEVRIEAIRALDGVAHHD